MIYDSDLDEESDEEMMMNIRMEDRKVATKRKSVDEDTMIIKWEEVDPLKVDDVPVKSSMTNEELCSMCTTLLPKVTAENLQFMKDVVEQLQIMHERRLRQENQTIINQFETVIVDAPRVNRKVQKPRTATRIASNDKTELMTGSGVFVDRKVLSDLLRDHRLNPKEIVRRLLKLLVGEKNLAQMSAMGEGMRFEGVPSAIKLAVHDWVRTNCKTDLTVPQYNRTINLMCGNLRRKE